MAMVVVFVLLFFFPPFLQIGISRPSNNPLGEKILIFIFTLGWFILGFHPMWHFHPNCYSCPLIIIIFKGFKISPRFQFIYFTLL